MLVRKYIKEDGTAPFDQWFKKLDGPIRARVRARIKRAELTDNLGVVKRIESIFEMKLIIGGGIRIYFGKDGDDLILLLIGGNKATQSKDIERAKKYWEDYHA